MVRQHQHVHEIHLRSPRWLTWLTHAFAWFVGLITAALINAAVSAAVAKVVA